MQNTSKINTVLLIIVIILLGVGIFVLLGKNNIDNRSDLNNNGQEIDNTVKDVYQNQNQPTENKIVDKNNDVPVIKGVTFSAELPKYITAQKNWPPAVSIMNTYSCVTGVSKGIDNPMVVTEKYVNGSKYCVSVYTEGAAGSQYKEYTYTMLSSAGITKKTNFTLRFTSCGVYGGPSDAKYKECKNSQDTFTNNLDASIDDLFN